MLRHRFADQIYRGFWTALDWIYPPECAGCGQPGYRLCLTCQDKMPLLEGKQCLTCGGLLKGNGEWCETCLADPPPYDAQRNLARYEGVIRECVHGLKYENNQSLGEWFSGKLATIVLQENWQIDLVVPVPLSVERQKERGYNQAALIARPLAARLSLRFHPYALVRVRDTRTQVGLSIEARLGNVVGAFKAETAIVGSKQILLVDDVMTTGATLTACTRALLNADARSVFCLTIARYAPSYKASNFKLDTV